MNYREFRQEILHQMRERADDDMKISLVDKQKLNGQLWWGLLMEREGCACAPVIYLENVYEEFHRGESLERIAEKLWLIYEEEAKEVTGVLKGNVSDMESFETASGKLFVRIFHRENNRELLEQAPFVPVLDLAMTVYYLVEKADTGVRGTIMIQKEHVRNWGVAWEEVFERAAANSLEKEGIFWNTVEEVLERHQLLPFPEPLPGTGSGCGLCVLSGRTGVWGAVMAFLPGTCRKLYELLGEEFYLLPSSIHEVLFIPVSRVTSRELLKRTVCDVNSYEMQQDEILSDSLYFYRSDEDRLEIAEV
ncbi:MAG: DUF5688 family protein [Lachnospiraceae bacterium]|nr:DUF5688 family protein [Lachnospiraceae bacterium]